MFIILKEENHPGCILVDDCIGPFESYEAAAAEAEKLYYDPRNYASPDHNKLYRFIVRELSTP